MKNCEFICVTFINKDAEAEFLSETFQHQQETLLLGLFYSFGVKLSSCWVHIPGITTDSLLLQSTRGSGNYVNPRAVRQNFCLCHRQSHGKQPESISHKYKYSTFHSKKRWNWSEALETAALVSEASLCCVSFRRVVLAHRKSHVLADLCHWSC